MKEIFVAAIFLSTVLIANSTAAQNIAKPEPGSYVWTHAGGCGHLKIARKSLYTWDEKCDGNVDYTAQKVRVTRKKITIDAATFKYSNVTADEILGHWKLFDFEADIAFVKE